MFQTLVSITQCTNNLQYLIKLTSEIGEETFDTKRFWPQKMSPTSHCCTSFCCLPRPDFYPDFVLLTQRMSVDPSGREWLADFLSGKVKPGFYPGRILYSSHVGTNGGREKRLVFEWSFVFEMERWQWTDSATFSDVSGRTWKWKQKNDRQVLH